MSARATSIRPMMAPAEHISLASEPDANPLPKSHKHSQVLATFTLTSKLRGLHTRLALLENHVVEVNAQRPGVPPMNYTVDLRFTNARPTRLRRIAWLWAVDSVTLLVLAGVECWRVISGEVGFFGDNALLIGVGAAVAAVITALWCVRSTTETLSFRSAHGNAAVIQVCGGIGSAKAGKKFFVRLIRAINDARLAAPPDKRRYLRDEMREHHRLRALGALSEHEYEAGKSQILKSHP